MSAKPWEGLCRQAELAQAEPGLIDPILAQTRLLQRSLEEAEERNIARGLSFTGFAFHAAQRELRALRVGCADALRKVADLLQGQLTAGQRRELLDRAYLIKTAPLTELDDLQAVRSHREARRRFALA